MYLCLFCNLFFCNIVFICFSTCEINKWNETNDEDRDEVQVSSAFTPSTYIVVHLHPGWTRKEHDNVKGGRHMLQNGRNLCA